MAVGGGARVLVVGTEQADEQGLRTASRDERGVGLRSYDARNTGGWIYGILDTCYYKLLFVAREERLLSPLATPTSTGPGHSEKRRRRV
jgi:hypothetical protein